VPTAEFEIVTERLSLRPWRTSDADEFAEMNADAVVMADLGGPLSRGRSDLKLERLRCSLRDDGVTRWVVTDRSGRFCGYCGIVRQGEDHPLGAHHEIGWRLSRRSWGRGYATEAAAAALSDAFDRVGSSIASAARPRTGGVRW
jgi:RimJ/RimL family protein N-acetyltransferase